MNSPALPSRRTIHTAHHFQLEAESCGTTLAHRSRTSGVNSPAMPSRRIISTMSALTTKRGGGSICKQKETTCSAVASEQQSLQAACHASADHKARRRVHLQIRGCGQPRASSKQHRQFGDATQCMNCSASVCTCFATLHHIRLAQHNYTAKHSRTASLQLQHVHLLRLPAPHTANKNKQNSSLNRRRTCFCSSSACTWASYQTYQTQSGSTYCT